MFDFEDGLRLIVSRERLPGGAVRLHVSASFRPDSRVAYYVTRQVDRDGPGVAARRWAAGIPERFRQLAGGGAEIRLLGFSVLGIPHFMEAGR